MVIKIISILIILRKTSWWTQSLKLFIPQNYDERVSVYLRKLMSRPRSYAHCARVPKSLSRARSPKVTVVVVVVVLFAEAKETARFRETATAKRKRRSKERNKTML